MAPSTICTSRLAWPEPLGASVSGRGVAVAHWVGLGSCVWGWSVRPARSGGEAGLGWVTSSSRAVGCGDVEDPGVIHGDVPAAPGVEVVVLRKDRQRAV